MGMTRRLPAAASAPSANSIAGAVPDDHEVPAAPAEAGNTESTRVVMALEILKFLGLMRRQERVPA